MWRSSPTRFDVATGIAIGARTYQEDAVVADFPSGDDCGIGVLADGMGGHAAGDVASAMVVGATFSDLKVRFASLAAREREVPSLLRSAVTRANRSIQEHVAAHPEAYGMGATVVATALVGPHLYWASVGDSPLFVLRDGALRRLNENHSMAPHIDAMIAAGQISADVGRRHPERSRLTSAVAGQRIARTDCPEKPFALKTGDIVLVCSDGLHTLDDNEIGRVMSRNRKRTSTEIVTELLAAVRAAGSTEQDNSSLMVVKVLSDKPLEHAATKPSAGTSRHSRLVDSIEAFDAVAIEDEAPAQPTRRAVGL